MTRPLYISPLVALAQIAMLAFLLLAICGCVSLVCAMAHGADQSVNVDPNGAVPLTSGRCDELVALILKQPTPKQDGRASPLVARYSIGNVGSCQGGQCRKMWRQARKWRQQ